DEQAIVRQAAAQALGMLGDPAAVPHLAARLEDSGEHRLGRVRDAAAEALARIGTPEALAALAAHEPHREHRPGDA
ncbi:MAG: HEAT repeat domain-containing protein, partial [Aggregatilineales bacterium]